MKRAHFSATVIGMALLIPGCAKYRPQPLEPNAALQQLQRVTFDDVLAESAKAETPLAKGLDLTDGLNEDEVALAAMFLSPELKAKREERGVAAGQLITAGLWPNPDFDSKFQRDVQHPVTGIEANLAFEVLRWRERAAERDAAKANVEAVRCELLADEWRIVSDARAAYWSVAGLDGKLRNSREALALADKLVQAARVRTERGSASSFDLNLAELDRARMQSEVLRTEAELASGARTLRQLMGLPPAAELRLEDAHIPSPAAREWNAEQLTALLPGSARLQAAEWRYKVAEGELQAAVSRQFPSLKLGPAADFTYEGGAWSSLLGSLVAFEAPWLHRNRGQIREKTAARSAACARYTLELHELRAQLAEAVGTVQSVERRLAFQRDELLPKTNDSIRLTEKAFEAGGIGIVELLKAQSSIIEAKAAHLDTLLEYRRALQSVESALGRRLQDALPPAAPASGPKQP